MKKTAAVLVLVAGCLILVAADNGRRRYPTPAVYDANQNFIGTLVDSTSLIATTPEVTVYVPSIHKVIPFDSQGNVASMALYFTSSDCSGTPYTTPGVLDTSILREFQGKIYTMKSTGSPPSVHTLAQSLYSDHRCYMSVAEIGGQLSPMALTQFDQPLPFTVPLPQPVTLR